MLERWRRYLAAMALDIATPDGWRTQFDQVLAIVMPLAVIGAGIALFAQMLTGYGFAGPYVLPGTAIGLLLGLLAASSLYVYGKRQAIKEMGEASKSNR